jgi:anti-sigma B factor antagonist
MKINHKEKDGTNFFELSGELDFHTSPQFRETLQALIEKQAMKIIINVKRVSYIDSSGLATFVEALQKIKRYSGKLILTELVPAVRGVFEIAKLDQVFSLANSEQEALQLAAD